MHCFADGCGLNTMPLPAFRLISALYMTVEVGLVEGMIAATTPMGTPISMIPCSLSSQSNPTVFMSLIYS